MSTTIVKTLPSLQPSPIVTFNNIMAQITKSLEEILFTKKIKRNIPSLLSTNSAIIFENHNIYLLDFMKIELIENEICFRFLKPMNKKHLTFVNNLYENFDQVKSIYLQYYMLYNNIAAGTIGLIPEKLLKHLSDQIYLNKFETVDKYYLLPIRDVCESIFGSEYGKQIMDNRQLVVSFKTSNVSLLFNYNIWMVEESDLEKLKPNTAYDERFYDKELIKSGKIHRNEAQSFVSNLFNYGKIIS